MDVIVPAGSEHYGSVAALMALEFGEGWADAALIGAKCANGTLALIVADRATCGETLMLPSLLTPCQVREKIMQSHADERVAGERRV